MGVALTKGESFPGIPRIHVATPNMGARTRPATAGGVTTHLIIFFFLMRPVYMTGSEDFLGFYVYLAKYQGTSPL